MGFLFDFLGNIFGYVLWFLFDIVSNYAIAMVLFVILVNIIMLPFTIKRQKTTALQSRVNVKEQELRKKYEKNPRKYNEERALLYEKEGFDPMAGCFSTMILPLVLWSGIFGAITKPLENTLHIPSEKVSQAVKILSEVPELKDKKISYDQLQLVKYYDNIKNNLNMLSSEELLDVEEYSHGFNFFGINLLSTPNNSNFSEFVWVITLLCLLGSLLTLYSNKIVQKSSGVVAQQAEGCMKFLPYSTLFIMTYLSWTVPAAVGLYWFLNSAVGAIQSIILSKYYNIYNINAKNEAARLALLEQLEQQESLNNNLSISEEVKK